MEAAVAAVEGRVSEPIVRALLVGSAGSSEGTLGGALKSLFGRSRRKAGLRSAFNASHSGSVTNRFYDITLTPTSADEPIVVQCPRTDSARTTIQALEDATGSKRSRITARRRKKQQREREQAEAKQGSDAVDES
jgi:hypothetical protein